MSTSPHLGKRVLVVSCLPPMEGTIIAKGERGFYTVRLDDGTERGYGLAEWIEL